MMPRVTLLDPYGVSYRCDSMNIDTLRAWFDEILPQVNYDPRAIARIQVHPMWSHVDAQGRPADADWSLDSRIIGGLHEFTATTGDEAIATLPRVRAELERLAGV